ncbi:DNA-directed RNA polymerase [Xanthomonas phage SB3]|uniref:DNA-directed RNA polymerase n=1 Tax=Xanthomonas phage SB3 TaxID=3117472 RepID=A0ABZ2GXZ7_9CAUD
MHATQRENELEVYGFGRDRMRQSIEVNAEKGRAHNNPSASAVNKRFVLPLAAMVKADVEAKKVGRLQAHVALLRGMDHEAVAYLAVRNCLSFLLEPKSNFDSDKPDGRKCITSVGRAVYHEHLLTQFSDVHPVLFNHMVNDLDRRLSVNESHRMRVLRDQSKKAGQNLREWSVAEREQVGAYLVECLSKLGMVSISNDRTRSNFQINNQIIVSINPDVMNLVSQIDEHVINYAPYFEPCIEPPKDWVAFDDGGFHTNEMRRLQPYLVKSHPSMRDNYRQADLSQEMKCVNAMQRTPWRINNKMLDAITNVAHTFDMKEIISQAENPAPRRPDWLTVETKTAEMNDHQRREFKQWKRETANWHTDNRMRDIKSGRMANALRIARKYREYSSIYFVYFLDFRGRKYAQTQGVSPQGSDLQKALIEFAEGKPLLTDNAKRWFKITGANRYGVDKVTLDDRVKWVDDNHDQLMRIAADPVAAYDLWREADKPLQFLAWALEYGAWVRYGDNFHSRISAGMDGSCNGLQNFSAMLRDPVGGIATNLVPGPLPKDIYQMVADLTTTFLERMEEDDAGYRTKWLDHALTRKLVKRSVMTLPYGSKRSSCRDFIIKDYLKDKKFPELAEADYFAAAEFLSWVVWRAIGDVVVAAREAMDWLQRGSSTILRSGYDRIRWVTPSGFPACQVYWETDLHRINTKLCGNTKLSLKRDTEKPDKLRHRNGIAPNFVHSMDASHLTLTVCASADRGITAFHMVHDDFGTHCADAQELYEDIREQFIGMYQRHDMLQELRDAYPMLPEPPPMGTLDLETVRDSLYFFS